jgi:hypothetical protein
MSIYYVSTLGNDQWNGGPATPFATVQKAASVMSPGDICNILGGTYTTPSGASLTFENDGTSGNYITFQNYESQSVTLNVTSGSYFLNGNGKTYNQVLGINFGGAATYGIWLQSCDHITINGCGVNGKNQDSCIMGFNSTNLTITNNTCIASSALIWDEIISMDNVAGFTVSYNVVQGYTGNDRIGIDAKVGCTNGAISFNTVFNCDTIGIYLDARGNESNIDVFCNISYNNAQGGYGLASENGLGSLSNINIYNNLAYGNVRGFRIDQYGAETYQFTLENNDFYNNSPSGNATEIFISPRTSSSIQFSGCIIRNNILYSTTAGAYAIQFSTSGDSAGFTIDNNDYYNPNGWYTSSLLGTNNITSNPMLVSPTTNFALSKGSPCIGIASSIGAPTTDFAGNPWTGCIGAYQYQSGNFTHGTTHTASLTITEAPAGISCQVQLQIGTSLSSKVSFTSGSNVPVSVPITMPAAGKYSVYIDVYMEGVLIQTGTDPNQITVV